MKIYTKGGDKGTTSLVGGKRVPKNHPRVEAYGDLDELISFLGIIISDTGLEDVKKDLRKIQEDLMLISAHFASDGSSKSLKEVGEDAIAFLENGIDAMTAQL
ncbi:MAG: ATP:cob(I)alamin adenosyltransferase, partial [Bacteroidales bacterium]|nr:ATP:cob(I)alamin adenosyltransferase [Bacteroidales bacterium]